METFKGEIKGLYIPEPDDEYYFMLMMYADAKKSGSTPLKAIQGLSQ
jgi:hypothetical protein